MRDYESKENLVFRATDLYLYGHTSSLYSLVHPPLKGHVIEIDPYCVSHPCWTEIFDAANHIDTVSMNFGGLIEWAEDGEQEDIYQFFFSDIDVAKKMALRVRESARNIRKDTIRRMRLDEAGGFHDRQVLDQLFEIQLGRCYYSGDLLMKEPKNFVVDHIQSIRLGGSNWPDNLALVIKEINTWKGGLASFKDTLKWLSQKRGKIWLREQKNFCLEVDRKREQLNREFRSRNENNS